MAIVEESYRGHILCIVEDNEKLSLTIDGLRIEAKLLKTGDGFTTPLLPYKNYSDLLSLGKAVIRSRNWRSIAHKVAS